MSKHEIMSTQTLADIYRLPPRDIEEIINAQGEVCFSLDEEGFLIYTSIFDGCVRYHHRFENAKHRLHASDYEFAVEHMLLKVSSDIHYPSSFLLLDDLEELVEQHMDITEDTSILLSQSAKTALFFGHGEVINRLADDFEKIAGTVSVQNFLEWRDAHV
jgi:hypothetical protein